MNNLAYFIKQSKLSGYADDTQISYADKDPAKVEEVINSELAKIDQWCEVNKMQRNLSKYQVIVMGKLKASIEFRCENTTIPNCEEIELLGITMDNKLKFEKHIAKICRKVSQQRGCGFKTYEKYTSIRNQIQDLYVFYCTSF